MADEAQPQPPIIQPGQIAEPLAYADPAAAEGQNLKRGHPGQEFDTNKKLKGDNTGAAEASPAELVVRSLCDSKAVGGLIGKGGSVIKHMRTTSGAHINIEDAVPGAIKRIVSAKGNVDTVANALHLIADKILENKMAKSDPSDKVEDAYITLLVPQCQIGGVIGKGGSKIKVTRESSGAHIKISEGCLENSTEKTVSIKGNSDTVYKALVLICYNLYENADKLPRSLYWPKPDYVDPNMAYGMQYADPNAMYGMGAVQYGMAGAGMVAGQVRQQQQYQQAYQQPVAAYGAPAAQPQTGYAQANQLAGAQENVVIPIPDTLIGFVIGRGGQTVKQIRQQSRAFIKISDKQAGSHERVVTITGTRQANEIAVALINEKLSQYDTSYTQQAQ